MELSIIEKEIQNLQKQSETIFNSESMKTIYNNYLDKLNSFCEKSKELNKIFYSIRESQNNSNTEIVEINYINTIDINSVEDTNVRHMYKNMLKIRELCDEDTNKKRDV